MTERRGKLADIARWRADWPAPGGSVVGMAEKIGVTVATIPAPDGCHIAGCAVRDPDSGATLISLNDHLMGDPELVQQITAHELAHVLDGDVLSESEAYGPALVAQERRAWIGAAELLVPAADVQAVAEGRESAATLSARMGVCEHVVTAAAAYYATAHHGGRVAHRALVTAVETWHGHAVDRMHELGIGEVQHVSATA